MNNLAFAWAALLGVAPAVSAAVMVTTGGNGTDGNAYVTLSQDVTFTVTAPSTSMTIIFDNAQPGLTDRSFIGGSGLQYQVNGGPLQNISTWVDEYGTDHSDLTIFDSYLSLGAGVSLKVGDTVTLRAGTFMMNSAADATFVVFPSGNYDMFLTSAMGSRISDSGISAVPEPAEYAVVMGALCGLALWGRKTFARA